MSKLGFMYYPKDWQGSDRVFQLTLEQRAVYHELILLSYQHDNKIPYSYDVYSRRWNCSQEMIEKIVQDLIKTGLIQEKPSGLFIPSSEPRLQLIRGGSKGGSKGKSKPTPKPNGKPTLKPIPKPTPKQIEIESEIQIESEIESESFTLDQVKDFLFTDLVFIDALKMQHKDKNFERAIVECYLYHVQNNKNLSVSEWKKKFITWLSSSKPENTSDGPIIYGVSNLKPWN
jgi:hypothetical protein